MTTASGHAPPRYIAELHDALEVTLLATADLAFWRERLREEGLFPCERRGQAGLAISAVKSRFAGLRFQELTISVAVSERPDGSTRDGFYFVSAFNTSRLFALIERVCFRTPYRHAGVAVEVGTSPSIKVVAGEEVWLHAEMAAVSAGASTSEGTWEGKIYLPRIRSGKSASGKMFFARIGGHTEAHAFTPATDIFGLNPSGPAAIRWLLESRAVGVEWQIRRHAHHARSKTYDRPG